MAIFIFSANNPWVVAISCALIVLTYFVSFFQLPSSSYPGVQQLSPYAVSLIQTDTTTNSNHFVDSLSTRVFSVLKQKIKEKNVESKTHETKTLYQPPWTKYHRQPNWFTFTQSNEENASVLLVYPKSSRSFIEEYTLNTRGFLAAELNETIVAEWKYKQKIEIDGQIDFVVQSRNCLLIAYHKPIHDLQTVEIHVSSYCPEKSEWFEWNVQGTTPITALSFSKEGNCIYYSREDDKYAFRMLCRENDSNQTLIVGPLHSTDNVLYQYLASIHEFDNGLLGLKIVAQAHEYGNHIYSLGIQKFVKNEGEWKDRISWTEYNLNSNQVINHARLNHFGKQIAISSNEGNVIAFNLNIENLLIIGTNNAQILDFSDIPDFSADEYLMDYIIQYRTKRHDTKTIISKNGNYIGIIKNRDSIIIAERLDSHWDLTKEVNLVVGERKKIIMDAQFVSCKDGREMLLVIFRDGSVASYYLNEPSVPDFIDKTIDFISRQWKLFTGLSVIIIFYIWNEISIRRRTMQQ